MGAFFLVRKAPGQSVAPVVGRVMSQFAEQGFGAPKLMADDRYELRVYPKLVTAGENVFEADNGDFCCCTGTLLYQGLVGDEALARLYSEFDPANVRLEALYGAFFAIVRKSGRTFAFVDRLGIYKVYRDSEDIVWSSSFLAVLTSLPSARVHDHALYEYVLQGATYGERTVIKEIEELPCDSLYEVGKSITRTPMPGGLYESFIDHERIGIHLERNLSNLRRFYRQIVGCFGDRIDTALSGGYDSRLTLGLLREAGARPKVHVYGGGDDIDVRVAQEINAGETLGLQHVDKSRFPRLSIEEFQRAVIDNFYAFDGYPNDGIFSGTGDLATRRARCRSGEVMLNGGGGEIFRNFFYLRDASYTVKQLLWGFYSQFDPAVCTPRFSIANYYNQLGASMKRVLGIERNRLRRVEIELLYPLFRCRYWMGRNNAVNNRLGYALTPFIDYSIVRDAVKLPIKYKNFGTFEARLLQAVDPRLAAYNSSYGHDFAQKPPLKRMLKDLATHFRPAWSRPYIHRIGANRRNPPQPYTLSTPYRDAVLGRDYRYMGEFFKIAAVRNPDELNRICTLEFLFAKFQPDV